MKETQSKALLPAGLRDVLPPQAAFEAEIIEGLMSFFAARGYDRVKPPLVEFEDSLLDGPGRAMAAQTFRIMDPLTQRMMGVRADTTLQVARIALTRLAHAPRPLRLCYEGQVLRVSGSQLAPERQFTQVGTELIGASSAAADAEVVLLAVEALQERGVRDISVDLTLPTLTPGIISALGLSAAAQEELREALDHKDRALVAKLGGKGAGLLVALLESSGPVESALAKLDAIDLPHAAAHQRGHLHMLVGLIRAEAPGLSLTIDPVENRGFQYHSGAAFTLFSRGLTTELGRGGRYLAGGTEPATGFTLFMDSVLDSLPVATPRARLYLPFGLRRADADRLVAAGWVVVPGLLPVEDEAIEARRLGCDHMLVAGTAIPVE